MAKSDFTTSWHWSVWNNSLPNSSFQLRMAQICCFIMTNSLWTGTVKMLSILPGKHHFPHVFPFSLLTLIHMVLGALARMLVWCQDRYSSTLARFWMSEGYQWSGVLYFRLRYSRMAVLPSTRRQERGQALTECFCLSSLSCSFSLKSIQIRISSGV